MTNKEIEKFKQDLLDKQRISNIVEKVESLMALAKSIGAPIPPTSLPLSPPKLDLPSYDNFINEIVHNIHIVLQTETMFNACVFAKWSCICAAVASIAACVSIIVMLYIK